MYPILSRKLSDSFLEKLELLKIITIKSSIYIFRTEPICTCTLYSTMSLRKQYNFQNYLKLLFRSPSEVSSREFLLKSHDTVIFRNIRYNMTLSFSEIFVITPFSWKSIYRPVQVCDLFCTVFTVWPVQVEDPRVAPSRQDCGYYPVPSGQSLHTYSSSHFFCQRKEGLTVFFACHNANSSRLFEGYNS